MRLLFMILQDLLPNYFLENEDFECKRILNRENTLSWLKTVDGFANAKGGQLLLGVEDKTFKLIGYNQGDADKEKLFFHNEIANHMTIGPEYSIETIKYEINGAARFLIKIQILEARKKPLLVKYDGMPMVFMRRDGFTNPATEEEIRMMVLTSDYPSFDSSKTDIDYISTDFSKLFSFYKERTDKDLKTKELESIGFIVDGKITNGAYLFSDHYTGDRSKIVCSLYRGNTRGDDTIISSNSFSGNLIDCYHYIDSFIKTRMNHGFIKLNDRREEIDAYPSRAVFEAIINALAHRDYLLDGTQINIDIFTNRLVISSPGSLFEGNQTILPTYDLSSFVSKRRNEVISNTFVLAKAMEARGTGLEKIMDAYSKYDKKHQPFIYSKNNTFHIVLPDLTNEQGISLDEESVYLLGEVHNPTRFDLSVLAFCYMEPKNIREITEYLGISNSSFFKKNTLENLVSQSYLEELKFGNAAYFITNKNKVNVR